MPKKIDLVIDDLKEEETKQADFDEDDSDLEEAKEKVEPLFESNLKPHRAPPRKL